ncbi:molecular chaperone [Massilia sp. Se16.2.3]|uniref:TorD/DmsD family molecular chaperone n=2 Tax=unclassified Massilia TaxID=2609279 RepID=UPI001E2DBEBF|nr:molecular chaperone TorD family protein [Massilia sp. Se16.2.3]
MPLAAEDQARSDLYALAARLLLAPPGAELLAQLGSADPILASGGDHRLEDAREKLVLASSVMDAGAVAAEFDLLFISNGTPALNPYGSLYLSGFMNDTPLAELRGDLARFGVKRMRGVGEFEDHLGALCETMRVLIAGGAGIRRQPLAQQKAFFEARIARWYGRCLNDIQNAEGANFYRLVARFVDALLTIEREAFAVDDGFDD